MRHALRTVGARITTQRMVRDYVTEFLLPAFFFQAEDGIRDHCVTGVQTCALPISTIVPKFQLFWRNCVASGASSAVGALSVSLMRNLNSFLAMKNGAACWSRQMRAMRSEERRVGKECRSRWAPYQ